MRKKIYLHKLIEQKDSEIKALKDLLQIFTLV